MKYKHTPGPWYISRLATPAYAPEFAIHAGDDHNDLARVIGGNSIDNARLIVAAPALLDALRAAQKLCGEALPKFNWGASFLDSDAIKLLNEVPKQISQAIAEATEGLS